MAAIRRLDPVYCARLLTHIRSVVSRLSLDIGLNFARVKQEPSRSITARMSDMQSNYIPAVVRS